MMAHEENIHTLELRIQRLERKLELLFRTLSITDPDVPGPGADPLALAVKNLLLQGQKMQAIAYFRRETGASLADAMRAVDMIAQTV